MMDVNGSKNWRTMPITPPRDPSPRRGNFLESFKIVPRSKLKKTPSGLQVAVLNRGRGPAAAKGGSVIVHYTGWLKNGTKFDSSIDKGEPFIVKLGSGQVIKGWEEGLVGIRRGEKRQLVIPAALAYGKRRHGDIPPNSTLVFNIVAMGTEPRPSLSGGNFSVRI